MGDSPTMHYCTQNICLNCICLFFCGCVTLAVQGQSPILGASQVQYSSLPIVRKRTEESVTKSEKRRLDEAREGVSGWRGPIWFPTAFLMIESLRKLDAAYGVQLKIPDHQGVEATAGELAQYFANVMISIFTRAEQGQRPVYGNCRKFQDDPHWRDYISFFEYFDGDTGKGLGVSQQTGWTALVALLVDEWRN